MQRSSWLISSNITPYSHHQSDLISNVLLPIIGSVLIIVYVSLLDYKIVKKKKKKNSILISMIK